VTSSTHGKKNKFKTSRKSLNEQIIRKIYTYNMEVKSKVNVKLSLCLTEHHAMKTYWVSRGIAPRIL
jgi:hypothetical protein